MNNPISTYYRTKRSNSCIHTATAYWQFHSSKIPFSTFSCKHMKINEIESIQQLCTLLCNRQGVMPIMLLLMILLDWPDLHKGGGRFKTVIHWLKVDYINE
ncbi:unnamed protein product [Heterobilharzia americana]|nr:unnamed protein product [Heterobilharzia americana]CAH8611214.1 unnamed protein product [Heterobilharzia americana]